MKIETISVFVVFVCIGLPCSQADTFGSGANQFDIRFVTIGDAGNPDDTFGSPAGKVEYAYRLSTYEVSRDMVTRANNDAGLGITLHPMDFVFGGPRDEMPATGITWLEAATFVNWLNKDQGHQVAYNFDDSGDFQLWSSAEAWQHGGENLFRHKDAFYFLPSIDEWYKAAYFNPSDSTYFNYPTGSDTRPMAVANGTSADTAVHSQIFGQGPADITRAGAVNQYGTAGQGGNVSEWQESEFDLVNDSPLSLRGLRGGSWIDNSLYFHAVTSFRGRTPTGVGGAGIGFRVASVPEPSSVLLSALAAGGLFGWRSRL